MMMIVRKKLRSFLLLFWGGHDETVGFARHRVHRQRVKDEFFSYIAVETVAHETAHDARSVVYYIVDAAAAVHMPLIR